MSFARQTVKNAMEPFDQAQGERISTFTFFETAPFVAAVFFSRYFFTAISMAYIRASGSGL